VALSGRLQPLARHRALCVLRQLERKIRAFHPDQTLAVGTGTLRRAKNSKSFLLPASKILKKPIRLLSGHEEGRVIALAARTLSSTLSPRFHIDLGGGSIEIIDSLRPTRPKIFPPMDQSIPFHPQRLKKDSSPNSKISCHFLGRNRSRLRLPYPT
jgi:exopolyphosphatase/guanosine-5'-triphosphate,3'-diphosphate pyrophosphatase